MFGWSWCYGQLWWTWIRILGYVNENSHWRTWGWLDLILCCLLWLGTLNSVWTIFWWICCFRWCTASVPWWPLMFVWVLAAFVGLRTSSLITKQLCGRLELRIWCWAIVEGTTDSLMSKATTTIRIIRLWRCWFRGVDWPYEIPFTMLAGWNGDELRCLRSSRTRWVYDFDYWHSSERESAEHMLKVLRINYRLRSVSRR